MTLLDSPDALARALAQLTHTLETLLKVEQAIQTATAAMPSGKQLGALTFADGLLGEAAHDITQARLALMRLERMR